MRLRISSRKSDLARLQSYLVGEAIKKKFPKIEIDFQFRESLGDKNLQDPLWKMPEKGVFTEDFYRELVQDEADMVVHSWKDLPTEVKPDTQIVATLERADQRDLLLFKKSSRNKPQLQIFSSSPRRAYNLTEFLSQALPWNVESLKFLSVRGNIQTRVRKMLESKEVDGLVLAKAAVDRLLATTGQEFFETRKILLAALQETEFMVLPLSVNPNAAAQGAIAVEVKNSNTEVQELLAQINHVQSFRAVNEERTRLAELGGGCHQKVGIAVLPREYGEIRFEQGLSDSGKDLKLETLIGLQKPPRFAASQLWSLGQPEGLARSALDIPSEKIADKSIWIARVSAWPKNYSQVPSQLVWSAGLQTWLKLAKMGVWVHGSAEGLGEDENPNINLLVKNQNWLKLTHDLSPMGKMPQMASYRLDLGSVQWDIDPVQQQFFYWRSGSQFRQALQKYPLLRERYHASGPGSTQALLLKELPKAKVFVFLQEQDWRRQCQK